MKVHEVDHQLAEKGKKRTSWFWLYIIAFASFLLLLLGSLSYSVSSLLSGLNQGERDDPPLFYSLVPVENENELQFSVLLQDPISSPLLLAILAHTGDEESDFYDHLVYCDIALSIQSENGDVVWDRRYNRDGKVESFWGMHVLVEGKRSLVAALRIGRPALKKGEYSFHIDFVDRTCPDTSSELLVVITRIEERNLASFHHAVARILLSLLLIAVVSATAAFALRNVTRTLWPQESVGSDGCGEDCDRDL